MANYLLVADVLGFSNIVKNLPPEKLEERVDKWINLVQNSKDGAEIKKLQLISDTVFALEEDSKDGFRRLLEFSKLLLERGMKSFFPIRGAIARGDLSWSNLIYGEALLDAYKLEKSLEWIGIACRQLQDVPWSWDLVCRYAPPLKSEAIEQMAVVAWNIPDHEELIENWEASGMLGHGRRIAWDEYNKIMNTMIFDTYLHNARTLGLNPSTFAASVPSAIRPPFKFTYDDKGNLHHPITY